MKEDLHGLRYRLYEVVFIDNEGTTIKELSERAKISRGSLYEYIFGDMTPTLQSVYRMAAAWNVNEEWLLLGKGEKNK